MHKRKEIIANQTQFKEEIIKALKAEFRELKKDINNINSKDPEIILGKNSLLDKSKKIKINDEINKLFISWKNVYPAFYAWWDEMGEQVLKLKYIDN